MSVAPKTSSLEALGETVQLSAVATGNRGVGSIGWASLDPSVATVDAQGFVTAVAVGEARVIAKSSTGADTAVVAVSQVPFTVSVQRADGIGAGSGFNGNSQGGGGDVVVEMEEYGQEVRLVGIVRDRRGNAIPGAGVLWTSLNPGIVNVGADGTVTAEGNGEGTIEGKSGAAKGEGKVVVNVKYSRLEAEPAAVVLSSIGEAVTLTVRAWDKNGRSVSASGLTFTSLKTSVASVNNTGRITSAGNGTGSVVVAGSGTSDTVKVIVQQVATTLRMSPASVTLNPGKTTNLSATAYDARGVLVPGMPIVWSSSKTSVASVDASGRVTASQAGTADITAKSQGLTVKSVVTVSVIPVASISLSPTTGTIAPGQTLQLTATTRDASNNVLADRLVTWSSSNPAVAGVEGDGLVYGQGDGTVTITATSEGRTATASIVVRTAVASVAVQPTTPSLDIAQTVQLNAALKDGAGNALNRPVTWVSSNAAVATVSAQGLVTAKAAGTSTVYATSEGVTGSTKVTVLAAPAPPAPVATVVVTPASTSVQAGGTVALQVVLKDAAGNVLTGRTVVWTSANAPVASVSSAGVVSALKAGSATLKATSEGKSANAQITVTTAPSAAPTIHHIVITASADTLDALDATSQLAAVAYDANGTVIPNAGVQWRSLNQTVATTTEAGKVTAKSIGTALIIASASGGCADTTAVLVRQLVDRVVVQPSTVGVDEGADVALTAQALDGNGNPINPALVVWTSEDPAIATVDAAGHVKGIKIGATHVRASRNGVFGRSAVAVALVQTPYVPASIVINSTGDTIRTIGGTKQLTATVRDAGGNAVPATVQWSSLNTAIATVAADGVVTAVAAGTARVVATAPCCALADTVNVVVEVASAPATLATLTVSPASTSIVQGGTGNLSVTAKNSNGGTMSGVTVTWTSSAPAIATIDAAGKVTALAVGSATMTAKSGSVTGAASLTVTAAPPPPPPPSQGTGLLFSDSFDGKKTNANGYVWNATPVNVSLSTDIAHTGSHSLKFHYPAKPDLCDDASAEQRLGFGEDLREAWIEYYIYLPNGTEGLGAKFQHRAPKCTNDPNGVISNNKFFAIWDTNYAQKNVAVAFEYRRMTSGPVGDSYLYGMHGTDTRATGQYGSGPWSPAITDATRGRWIQIRIHVKVATSKAAADGGYEMWANGQRVISALDRDLAPNPGGNNFFRNMYLMGWSNSGFDQDTNMYIDDFKIFGSNPGW